MPIIAMRTLNFENVRFELKVILLAIKDERFKSAVFNETNMQSFAELKPESKQNVVKFSLYQNENPVKDHHLYSI
jgi:hypothetical protein